MDVRVSGHQVETGDALKTHVDDRLQGLAEKYFSRAISAQVVFGKGPHEFFTCDIVAHVMQGLILKSSNQGQDAHGAFDGAAGKIEKQLRRYMSRLKDRNNVEAIGVVEAMAYDAGYTVFDGAGEVDEVEIADAPPIIAETRVDIPSASVSDAVMMLDLRNTNALLFKNSVSGTYNMVYRRHDGTIGWVEPNRVG